jgi:hypothetical protein
MRRICIALCFSLFASLIHAGGMPISTDTITQAHSGHVVQHDKKKKSDLNVEKSQSTNHQAQHQCCLGVLANLSTSQYIQPEFSNHFVSQFPQLIIEAVPSHIFKPPRLIS